MIDYHNIYHSLPMPDYQDVLKAYPIVFINKKNHCLTVWSSHYYSQRTDGHGFETLSLDAYSIMYVSYNQHKC